MIELLGMTWDHPRGYAPMAATAEAYARTHPGVRIHWEKRSLQAFADHPLDQLAAKYDLLVIDHPHAGFAHRDGCLVAFDRVGRDAELAVLAKQSLGPSHRSYEFAGHQWALAIDTATQISCYRPDMMTTPPTAWSDVVELAKDGRVLWPMKPVDAISSFNTLSANRGTPIAQSSDRLIDPTAGAEVLEAMWRLAVHVPRECLTLNPPQTLDWMSGTGNERYAYCPLLYGYTNYARPGAFAKLIKFTNIPAIANGVPGRGSQLGGAGIAISSRCKYLEVAVDYSFWIAGAECQRTIYFEASGQPGNAAAWDDDRCNTAASDFFRDTRKTHDTAWVRPTYDGYLNFQDRGGDIVNAFLAGKLMNRAALEQLEAAYRESRRIRP